MDSSLASKVAAGEVITRPLNAVKELIENSLDAGASNVQIELQYGGKRLISVADDGEGMSAQDLELCILSHATSKISRLEDFLDLISFGFRGEALASVAAVSKLTIESITNQSEACLMNVMAGKVQGFGPSARARGTRVEIKELFYNIPARLKFLKSDNYEKALVVDLVQSFMATHPEVGFQLSHNGQRVLVSSGQGSYPEILAALFGARESRKMIEIPHKKHPILGMQIHGFLSPSTMYRSNSKDLRLFINRRIIKHPPILKAIQTAYENLSAMKKWPLGLIFLQIPPAMLDVNVHPMKLELRIENEPLLLEFIAKSLRSALLERSSVPKVELDDEKLKPSTKLTEQVKMEEARSSQLGLTDFFTESSLPQELLMQNSAGPINDSNLTNMTSKHSETLIPKMNREGLQEILSTIESPTENLQAETVEIPSVIEVESKPNCGLFPADFKEMRIIGQLKKTFILAEYQDSLVVVDQHVAQERILYENIFESLKGNRSRQSRNLLVPISFELSSTQVALIESRADLLIGLGFKVDLQNNQLKILAVPEGLSEEINHDFIDELIASLEDSFGFTRLEEHYAEIAESMACRGSIKAGDELGEKEMQILLRDLSKCENPFHCPHGRPILVEMSYKELYKKFDRVYKRQD